MQTEIIKAYNEAVYDTDRDRAMEVIHAALKQGVTPEEIVFDVVIPAMESMMQAISEDFDANLAQHFMAAQIASQVTEEMIAQFKTPPESLGTIVIGTSVGDMHTLGKRIVSGCLRSMMIDVVDLGVNIKPEAFVDKAVEIDSPVIAISSMMMHTATSENGCQRVREILKERGLEDKIKIVVGGAPYRWDNELYKTVGADAWADNGITAGEVIKKIVMEAKS
ncbi:methylmalonyl-CoA mutase C-terminal domain-containing protein [Mariprofundus aestuarium]|uniref:Methylmalonyl-CoA mutase C-terminal domain-containing protein n=1 Tax=Mariprofundus aestuarium TaxID=1921086 RepID=A0A2K8KVB6_MARES|nr:cobalamin-dependent protein [Mariprofundus aestuarium]ATX78673.1 methylmalonyl-CoA mutase C-terminal domain-containing protein [Mariprofundus aestuarium]